MKILIVEDEPLLREGLTDLLRGAGHVAEAVADGERALARGTDPSLDLLLLDVMLPKLDGIEVCRRIRELSPRVPILMLTARGAEDDKIAGLRAGADDYVTKPFSARELLARIDALGRRAQAAIAPVQASIETGGCTIELDRSHARRDGIGVPLTYRESCILRCLFQHRSRAVSRVELLETVWGYAGDVRTRTVDMTIANLRQKIERDPARPEIVVTVKGVGYAWGGS